MIILSSRVMRILFIGLAIAVLARFAGGSFYLGDMLSHFSFHFSLVALCFAVFFIIQRKILWWVAALIICAISAYPWLSLWTPGPPAKESAVSEDITVLQFNIYFQNTHADQFVQWVNQLASPPDIIVIQEFSFEVAPFVAPLKRNYPYTVIKPEENARGVAIYSKLPILTYVRRPFAGHAQFDPQSSNEYTVATLQSPIHKIPIALIELHTITPMLPYMARQRNKELAIIAEAVKALPEPHKILIGDINNTPYSYYFKQLKEQSGLRSAMQGFGLKNTWRPVIVPVIFGIPIDHMLLSEHFKVLERAIGPDLGSDHLPVITKLRLYQ